MRTRVLTASGIVAGALLVFAVVPKVSGGNHSAPDRDDAEVSLSEGPPVPPIAPEEPSARRDLPDRPAESASESPPSAEDIAARIAVRFPLEPTLRLGGKFTTVPGDEAAPGTGRKVTYRVEIEEGLALDGGCSPRSSSARSTIRAAGPGTARPSNAPTAEARPS